MFLDLTALSQVLLTAKIGHQYQWWIEWIETEALNDLLHYFKLLYTHHLKNAMFMKQDA